VLVTAVFAVGTVIFPLATLPVTVYCFTAVEVGIGVVADAVGTMT